MATPYRVTAQFWDHATLWGDDESMAGHTTDGGRVFGITRTRYVECDHYKCRPVAVIDPEDREQIANLVELLIDNGWRCTTAHGLRDALREFANPKPPRPDEPQGLGAVVRDDAGRIWIRVEPALDTSIHYAAWRNRVPNAFAAVKPWSNINAIEVLSEGVQP